MSLRDTDTLEIVLLLVVSVLCWLVGTALLAWGVQTIANAGFEQTWSYGLAFLGTVLARLIVRR